MTSSDQGDNTSGNPGEALGVISGIVLLSMCVRVQFVHEVCTGHKRHGVGGTIILNVVCVESSGSGLLGKV